MEFRLKSIGVALSILVFLISGVRAQESPKKTIDPNLNAKEDAYLDRQAEAFLLEASETLKRFPPQYPEPRERHLGLLLLDAVLHDVYAAHRAPVRDFYRSRMEAALAEIESTQVEEGAVLWRLYNMGVVVRTKTVTLAFDLVRGDSSRVEGFGLPDDLMNRFVNQCDVLFISHRHRDHTDLPAALEFVAQGKPVVAPPQVWSGQTIHDSLTRLERKAHDLQSLPIQNGKQELKVVVYPGHQMAKVENNVPLVFTPEGLSFCHMGDQINEGDFMIDYDWIDKVAEHHKVDVLIPPCWTNEILRIVQGFNPRLVLPAHENELGHPIDDRVPYWGDSEYLNLTYPELKKSEYPTVAMTWGESIRYLPE